MTVDTAQTATRKHGSRSPLAKHLRRVMPGIDLRSAKAKRWRVIYEEFRVRLEGPDGLSERDEQRARDWTVLEVARRDMQAEQIQGKTVDAKAYSQIVARLERADRQIEEGRLVKARAKPAGNTMSRIMGGTE